MSSRGSPEAKWKQLMLLRGVTSTTGVLHEAQVLQLKCWPLVLFPHAKASEAVYYDEEKRIEIRLKLSKRKAPTRLKKRLEILNEWIKDLLGPEFVVRIVIDGKTVFTSLAKRPKKAKGDGNR